MNDDMILDLYFARDEEALAQTEKSYGRRLHALADRILENKEDAEESVSDTYLKAWQTIPPVRPSHFFGYLSKICRNFCLSRLDWKNAQKRSAQVVALTQEMEGCLPDVRSQAQWEARELGAALDRFLRSLPQENRMIFLRRYWYVDTIAEIAQRYGISEKAVQMRLLRTRKKLAQYLKKEEIAV